MKKTIDHLNRLKEIVSGGSIPRAQREWGGADVVISAIPPPKTLPGFYPDPRFVVTPCSFELSWMFESLRDAFRNRIDSCSKIEFFGRLANAAERFMRHTPDHGADGLCAAVLDEAFAILEEMEKRTFRCFTVAIGNEIYDDYVDRAPNSGQDR